MPFILMLHGGGQDENYFPTLDGGKLLKLLDSRGYLMASPKYIGSSPSFVADMLQLVELMRKESRSSTRPGVLHRPVHGRLRYVYPRDDPPRTVRGHLLRFGDRQPGLGGDA